MPIIYEYDALGFATGFQQEVTTAAAAPSGWTFDQPPVGEGQIAYRLAGAWFLVNADRVEAMRKTAQMKSIVPKLNTDIDTERTVRIAAGMPYAFPDGTDGTIQLRHERDILNVNAVGTAAMMMISAGDTSTKLDFRDQEDVTHQLTAPEMLATAQDVMGWISAHYAAAWVHKDAIKELVEAGDVAAVATYDITQGWPT